MKKTILATACLTIFSASTFASITFVDRDGDDNGEINLTGNVPERCVVSMDSTDVQQLDLSNPVPQLTVKMGSWCNRSNAPTITFSSDNGGKLVNETNDEIGYLLSWGGVTRLSLDTDGTEYSMNSLGFSNNKTGFIARPDVIITPNALQAHYARQGDYSDRITVQLIAQQ